MGLYPMKLIRWNWGVPIFSAKAIPGLVNIEQVIQAMATEIVDLPIKRRCLSIVMLVYQSFFLMV